MSDRRPLPQTVPAKQAFVGMSADYQRCRPDYPRDVIEWIVERLGLHAGDRVVDVGAGTGIFTRRLCEQGLRPIAVDLSSEMLGQIERGETLGIIQTSGDVLPLRNESVRAVTAAQAFHWFDPEPTLREWHRVVAPGGGVALVWNDRDVEQSAFNRDFEALIVHHNPRHRLSYREMPVEEILGGSDFFESVESRVIARPWPLSHADVMGFAHSVSYIMKALDPGQLREFDADLQALLARHFPSGEAQMPLRCRAWVAHRRD